MLVRQLGIAVNGTIAVVYAGIAWAVLGGPARGNAFVTTPVALEALLARVAQLRSFWINTATVPGRTA